MFQNKYELGYPLNIFLGIHVFNTAAAASQN